MVTINKEEQKQETKKNIYTAMLDVMRNIKHVNKSGKISYEKTSYSFPTEADIIDNIKPAMLKECIIIYPAKIEILPSEAKTEYFNSVKALYTFIFMHVSSQTSIEVMAIGEGQDKGDKASYKAATGALKYALRQSFLIATKEDGENNGNNNGNGNSSGNGNSIELSKEKRKQIESEIRDMLLEITGGNKNKAADLLGSITSNKRSLEECTDKQLKFVIWKVKEKYEKTIKNNKNIANNITKEIPF